MTYTVVLTGGIASGKTAVSRLFEELGTRVIDTDLIARDVVEPGRPALAQVVEVFGKDCLDHLGQLDRKRMRALVFSDPSKRALLEGILHPAIADEVRARVKALRGGYCILVIPLYRQGAGYNWVNRVLVIDVDEETQVQRVMNRDGIDRGQAMDILTAQPSREERLEFADDVLNNSGTLEDLPAKVKQLHQKYLELSGQTTGQA